MDLVGKRLACPCFAAECKVPPKEKQGGCAIWRREAPDSRPGLVKLLRVLLNLEAQFCWNVESARWWRCWFVFCKHFRHLLGTGSWTKHSRQGKTGLFERGSEGYACAASMNWSLCKKISYLWLEYQVWVYKYRRLPSHLVIHPYYPSIYPSMPFSFLLQSVSSIWLKIHSKQLKMVASSNLKINKSIRYDLK